MPQYRAAVIGNGDDVNVGYMKPDGVDAMTVVASPGVTDDGCAILRHDPTPCCWVSLLSVPGQATRG